MRERDAYYRFCALSLGAIVALMPWIRFTWWAWMLCLALWMPAVATAVLDRFSLSGCHREFRRVSVTPAPTTPAEDAGAA